MSQSGLSSRFWALSFMEEALTAHSACESHPQQLDISICRGGGKSIRRCEIFFTVSVLQSIMSDFFFFSFLIHEGKETAGCVFQRGAAS